MWPLHPNLAHFRRPPIWNSTDENDNDCIVNWLYFCNETHRPSIKPVFRSSSSLSGGAATKDSNLCYSLVSPPLLAEKSMDFLRECVLKTLAKNQPPGPLKRAKKGKKLNPIWRREVKGIFVCPNQSSAQPIASPFAELANGIRLLQGLLLSSLFGADHQPLPSGHIMLFPPFGYYHLAWTTKRGT